MKDAFFNYRLGVIVIVVVLAFLFFTGAAQNSGPQQTGRYRLSVINRGNFTDLFVIDTATGIVKWVGGDEGKPFDEIKGH